MARADRRWAGWLVVATAIAGSWTFAACGEDATEEPGASSGNGSSSTSSSGGGSSSGESSSGATSSGATSSGSTSSSSGSTSGGVNGSTDPNFKVAFIGDTAAGNDFKAVLQLVKREKAQAVVIQGDLTYSGDTAGDWFPVVDGELDAAKIPYFVSRGNHDDDWNAATGLAKGLEDRLTKWGVTPDNAKPSLNNYSLTYKGLKMVFVHESETTNPTRADYVKQQLETDKHVWKICSWHKNMRATNVGPKSDEMGWQIYENCRAAGAIVAQGHSHTYSRSKTMTADQALTVDAACSDPFALCVGPGKHFFFDSSLGGVDRRTLNTTVAGKPYWASTYAADFGALFIEFNVDGDPKKAKGYFKTVGDVVIDPPAASGKTFFTITSSN